jgi:hypothetical protein
MINFAPSKFQRHMRSLSIFFLYFTILLAFNLQSQTPLSSIGCPSIDKRSNGNGQASSAAGDFRPTYAQNNPVAPNITGTSYQLVPFNPQSKTGNFNFRWPVATTVVNLPVITRVWTTPVGSETAVLSPIKFGPPPPIITSGNFKYANYCFYVQNMPNAGRVTLEFSDPQTDSPVFWCTFDLGTGVSAAQPTNFSCGPTVAVAPISQTFCGNGSVTFTSSISGYTSFKWQQSSNNSTWTDISAGGDFTTVNATTLTVANRNTYTGKYFRIQATNSCGTTNSTSALLTVNSLPTAVFTNSSSLCGLSVSRSLGVDFTGTGPWSFTYTLNGTPTTVSNITSDPYYFTVSPAVASTYIITSVSDSKCSNSSPTGNVSVAVNATPTITPTNASACLGSSNFSLAYTSTGSPNQYSITSGARSLSGFSAISNASLTASPQSVTIPTTGITAGTYDFNAVVTNSTTGCVSASTPFTLTINGLPSVTASASSNEICVGSTTTLTTFPSNLSSYAWRISPSSTILSSSASYTPTVNSNTTFTVIGTDANGCSSSANVSITTNSGSPLTITPSSATICPGSSATILVTGANSYTWSPSTGLSSTLDDQVVASPSSTTTYTITGTNLIGCQSNGTVTVTVASAPISVTASASICAGSSQTLTASGGSTYIWYPSTGLFTDAGCTIAYSGTNLATVYAKPTSTTTYFVNGTTAGGCSAIASSTVTITAAPVNSATSTPNYVVFCTQGTATLALNVVMTQAITSPLWYSSTDGITYTQFTNQSAANTLTGVTATPSTTGTSPTITYTCTLSGYGNSAYGGPLYFRLGFNSATCNNYNYDFFLGDTKSKLSPAAPASTKTTVCSGDNLTLTIGALASGSTAQWQSSLNNTTWTNINLATSATYTTGALTANTYYRVVYNGGSGNCGSTSQPTLITVNSALASNTVTPTSSCTTGSGTITLTGSAITTGVYQWQTSTSSSTTNFSDILGATSQNYTLPFNIVSTQTWYRRIASNGTCSSKTSEAVVVTPPVTGNYISASTTSYCNGTAPSVTLNGTTPIGGNSTFTYQWQSSTDGTNFSNITSTNTVNYTTVSRTQSYWYRRLVTSDQCSADVSNTIKITVNANPTISVTASATICSGTRRALTASGASSYTWSPATFLSATAGPNVVSTPTASTTYTVTGTDANGCTNTATTTITVNSIPSNPTISSNSKTICSGSENLNSLITSGGTNNWYTVPEANSSYLVSTPTSVSTAGTYYVFAVSGSCFSNSSATYTLSVNDVTAPIPTASSAAVCSPNTFDLTSLQPVATSGTELRWHTVSSSPAGDNLISAPTTASAGTYYLYAYSTAGTCYGSSSTGVTVTQNAQPTVSLISSSQSVCESNAIDLTTKISSPSGSFTYNWYTTSTNPPVTSDLVSNPSEITASGTFYVHAFNNSTGCKSASPVSFTATVNTDPTLSLTSPSVGCSGTSTSLVVAVTNGVSSPTYQWKIFNQSNGNWDNVSNGGVYSGATSTTLSISNNSGLDGTAYYCEVTANGCSSNSSVGVIGVSQPNVPTFEVIHPTCTVFTGTVEVTSFPLDLVFALTALSGSPSYQSSTTFSSVANGNYTLTAKDLLNCTNSTSVELIQPAIPVAPNTTNSGHCMYSFPTGSVADVNGFTSPTFKWYTASSNGSLLQTSTATTYSTLTTATATYYVSVVHPVSGCESSRAAVTDTVIDPVSVYNPVTNVYVWKGGAVGNLYDWMTTTNWVQYDGTKYITVNQVPSSSDNVIIPPSSRCITAQPTVSGAADQFINIDIKPGGVLTVSGNGVMNVSGNWTNNGTFICGTGTVNFVGAGNHFIQGSNATTFYNVVVNKPINGINKSVLKLNTQAYITGELTLTSGLFDISTFDVNMDGRDINGGSDNSYVQTSSTGRLQRNVSHGNKHFPVGRSSYNPASLKNDGTSDKYSIRVIDRLTTIGTNAETDPQSDSAVVNRTWMIDENVGSI